MRLFFSWFFVPSPIRLIVYKDYIQYKYTIHCPYIVVNQFHPPCQRATIPASIPLPSSLVPLAHSDIIQEDYFPSFPPKKRKVEPTYIHHM